MLFEKLRKILFGVICFLFFSFFGDAANLLI